MSFSPTSIANLTVWLDAADSNTITQSGGDVEIWATKSSFTGTTMEQATPSDRPTYESNVQNGLPAVRFTTAQNMETLGNTSMGPAQSWFVAFRPLAGGNIFFMEHGPDTNISNGSFLYGANNDLMQIRRGTDVRNIQDSAGVGITPFSVGSWYVTSLVVRNLSTVASNDIYWNINGTTRSAVFNPGSTVLSSSTTSRRFYLNPASRVPASNEVGEVLIYNRALTTSEVTQIQNYLGYKWGIYEAMTPGIIVNGGSNQIATSTSLNLYKYEPFSYVYSGVGGQSVTLVSTTTLIRSLVSQIGSEVHFEAPSGYNGNPSTSESIVLRTSPGNVTYTISITLLAGRFTAPILTSYVLNKNTSITDSSYGSPILFTSPIAISLPRSLTALPPGIGFVQLNPSNFYLTGTPLVTSPATSYNILGFGTPDTSKVVSKTITITVNDEVITTSLAGGSNVSDMIVDFPITDRVITSTYPNRFAGNLVYTWNTLPDGIRFIDLNGNTVSSGFAPLDVNSTIRLVGAPSLTAAYSFASLSLSNYPVTVRATRQTNPQISSSVVLNFSFAETVLFDPVSNVSVYTNAPIPIGEIPFTARTYFTSSPVGMQFIVASSGLPAGLVLSHTAGSSNAFLTGTSTGSGTGTYTLTAQNSNGVYRDVSVNITTSTDTVQFVSSSPIQDVCYNFIISRPLNQPKTGYYPSSIQYTATAASGSAITYSTANLPSGVTATTSGGSLVLSGIPDTVQSLGTAVITATAASTGANLSRNMNYQVLADTMVVTPTSGLSFFQNQTINRIQFTGTTLSERTITTWTSPNLPDGLSLTSTGFLSGTPANATVGSTTFDLVSSTGYYAQSNAVTYTTIGDNALVLLVPTPTTVSVSNGAFSNVNISVLSYSTKPITTFISNIFPVQNPSIALATNAMSTSISGDLTPAGDVYPKYEFSVYTQVSNTTIAEEKFLAYPNVSSTRINYILDVSQSSDYVPANGIDPLIFPTGRPTLYKSRNQTTSAILPSNWFDTTPGLLSLTFGYLSDFGHSKNSIVMVTGSDMYRATSIVASNADDNFAKIDSVDISNFSDIVGDYSNDPTYGVFTSPGPLLMTIASDRNSNWVALGQGFESATGVEKSIVRTSVDDGLTWSDISISPPFVARTSNSHLYYNSGRYFLAQPSNIYYADSSNLSTWTNTGVAVTAAGVTLAFSNQTIIASLRDSATSFISSNNGTTWTGLAGSNSPPVASYQNVELNQAFGTWVAALTDPGIPPSSFTYYYSNASTVAAGSNWASANSYSGIARAIDFDGLYFSFVHDSNSNRSVFVTDTDMNPLDIAPVVTDANIVQPPYTRRALSRLAGSPTVSSITFDTLVASSTGTSFVAPTKTDSTLFQYVGTNIPVAVTPTSNYIYYYASNLPQGLRLALDPSGDVADISGIPSRFSDGFQTSTIYARIPQENVGAELQLSFRVLIPFVMKKQDGAGSYTAFLRNYVTVNGAQASRDSVALPVETRPIGEFMHPGAPMVFTDSNCPC